ncbi:MAG TPA: hypothetical protein EYQ64_04295, partial [Gemmatimonadetes bacterium]|nr:hypothetical protein [Gemmatimonadota bacterium]
MESKVVGRWSLRLGGKAIHYGEDQGMKSDDLIVTAYAAEDRSGASTSSNQGGMMIHHGTPTR